MSANMSSYNDYSDGEKTRVANPANSQPTWMQLRKSATRERTTNAEEVECVNSRWWELSRRSVRISCIPREGAYSRAVANPDESGIIHLPQRILVAVKYNEITVGLADPCEGMGSHNAHAKSHIR